MVANVDGEFYPTGPDATEKILDILSRQVASPVQFVKGLHTLYGAGARMFVEVGPKKALHGFAEDVIVGGARRRRRPVHQPPEVRRHHVVQSGAVRPVCGGAGLAGRRRSRHCYPGRSDPGCGSPPVAATPVGGAARSQPPAAARAGTPAGRVEQSAGNDPVVITGAALGLPGSAHVFDDSNVARVMAAIARALKITSAKILILDEPTSSLDAHETLQLFNVMRKLKSEGMAIIFITHFLDQVYEITDRITVLRNGKLVGTYVTASLVPPGIDHENDRSNADRV